MKKFETRIQSYLQDLDADDTGTSISPTLLKVNYNNVCEF